MIKLIFKGGLFHAKRFKDSEIKDKKLSVLKNELKDKGWKWNKIKKCFVTASVKKAVPFGNYATGKAREKISNYVSHQEKLLAPSWKMTSDIEIPCPEGLDYMGFQKAFVEYAELREYVLLGDEPGLGKTVQSVALANKKRSKRILIICPAFLKLNWKKEWEKWCTNGLTVGIAESKRESYKDEKGKTKYRSVPYYPDTDVIIINRHIMLDTKRNTYLEEIRKVKWDILFVDEAQDYRNEKAVSTQLVYGLGNDYEPIEASQHIDLTGTPIMTKPLDLWPKLARFDRWDLGNNWFKFAMRYADAKQDSLTKRWDFSGSSNKEELGEVLRKKFMIRRLKEDVLKELPPKSRQIVELPSAGLEKHIAAEHNVAAQGLLAFEGLLDSEYEDVMQGLEDKEYVFQILEGDDYEQQSKNLTLDDVEEIEQVSTARKNLAIAKTKMVTEHVNRFLESGEKAVLFVHHKDVAKALRENFPKCAFVTGAVPQKKRQGEVDRFQEDPSCKLFVGNILAAGVGFTLTAASTVFFAELSWIPSDMEQAEDRLWRIGQKNAVSVEHLVVENSLDSIMVRRLIKRQKMISATLNSDTICGLSREEYRKLSKEALKLAA